jgi:hypothetical protein
MTTHQMDRVMEPRSQVKKGHGIVWARIGWGVAGALWFVWIGIEDPSVLTVLILSATFLSALAVTVYQRRIKHMSRSRPLRSVTILVAGFLGGLLVTPIAVVLMAVKISLHNHVLPDFSCTDVIQVLSSTPAWGIGALMLSAAGALLDRMRA